MNLIAVKTTFKQSGFWVRIVTCMSLISCSNSGGTRIAGSSGKYNKSYDNLAEPSSRDSEIAHIDPKTGKPAIKVGPGNQESGATVPDGVNTGTGADGSAQESMPSPTPGMPGESSRTLIQPETLVWKRYRSFESTLMEGLSLAKNQVCNELGQFSCIDTVHLTLLGGNEPFINGQHERAEKPTVLTPIAVERVVLEACNQRLILDKASPGQKAVFKHFDLAGAAVNGEQVKLQAAELYRRFYGRDPSDSETQAAQNILNISTLPEKVALGLCFSIGSSLENAFL